MPLAATSASKPDTLRALAACDSTEPSCPDVLGPRRERARAATAACSRLVLCSEGSREAPECGSRSLCPWASPNLHGEHSGLAE